MSNADIYASVEDRRERLESLANHIWENPELALQETEAAAVIQETLSEEGFEIESGIGGLETAFVARYGEGDPVVGTMGEYDALPGISQKRSAEREPIGEGEPGHGCGHNLFGVGSLGAALAVKDAIDRGDAEGTVLYYGTPAEEVGIGKVVMAREGAFDEADAIVSWHPGWNNSPGKGSSLAVDGWEVTFEGESSHAAAAPEAGRSALDALQLMNTGVEYMREHVPEAARIHYVIKEGGDAANVVPPVATGEYLVRAPDREQVEEISGWIEDIAEGAALMADVDATVRKTSGLYEVRPNVTLGDLVYETMEDLGSFEIEGEDAEIAEELRETLGDVSGALSRVPEDVREQAAEATMFTEPVDAADEGKTGSYSTDSGDVSQVVPLGRLSAATWPVGTPAHSWQAVAASGTVGTEGMVYAAKTIGGTLYDLLDDPQLLDDAASEFEERADGREYECALPESVDPNELVDR